MCGGGIFAVDMWGGLLSVVLHGHLDIYHLCGGAILYYPLVIWLTTSGDVTYGPRPYSVERTPRLGASIPVIIPLRLVSVKSYEYALMANFLGRAV